MQPTRGTRLVLVASFTLLAGYLGFVLATVIVGWKGYTDTFRFVTLDPRTLSLLKMVTRALITLLGLLLGFFFASRMVRRVVRLGHTLEETPARDKVAIIFGGMLAVVVTLFLSLLYFKAIPGGGALPVLLTLFTAVMVSYLSISATMSMSSELWSLFPSARPDATQGAAFLQSIKILDTNVIIDGRIADICHTGFLEGTLYVPGFVLDELQHIADSSDALKRARGRRGLDILNDMQKDTGLLVRDFDDVEGIGSSLPVDQKLIILAKHMGAAIVTNDFNLNKVAELQGVKVLNINALANAVKPVVLPGEEMIVQIIKEGKEANQGVGYLEDGTMIVVEGGKRHIGEHLNVTVSSVLQTVAGKMIFTQMRDQDEAARAARGDRAPRPRR